MFPDLKFAIRSFSKTPGFTFAVLATLALCIGANTAIFSMLYALVIKPLPFKEPARIVEIHNSFPKDGLVKVGGSVAQYLDFKEHARDFAQVGLWKSGEFTFGDERGPIRIQGAAATAEMFDVFGVGPLLGRFFTVENQTPQTDKVVVLTQSFWESKFQADPNVLGKTIRLGGEPFEIVGIAPALLQAFDARIKFIQPISWPPVLADRNARYAISPNLYGRLKPGATLAAAQAKIAMLERQFYKDSPPPIRDFLDRTGHVTGVDIVQAQRVGSIKTALYLLQGGVLFVLLIGCVNVANLLLARANARRGEFSIRAAVGATHGAIVRQLYVESSFLVLLGVALGLLLAWGALGAINYFTSLLMPIALPFAIDGRVLGYTALIAVIVSLAIGIFPVAQVLGGNFFRTMQDQGSHASKNRGMRTMGSALVMVQMAITLILLIGAGLLIRSFIKVLAVDPGFNPEHIVTARIALPANYYRDNRVQGFVQQLQARLQEIPGATSSVATVTPFQTSEMSLNTFSLRDYRLPPDARQPAAAHFGASPRYLETLGIPLLGGRWFNEADTNKSRQVLVVDEIFAKRYFPGRSAVGQRLTFGPPPAKLEEWPEIVGVVGNVHYKNADTDTGHPYLYHPVTQFPFNVLSVFVNTTRPLAETATLLRKKVSAIDPALPVFQVQSMEEVIGVSFGNRRGVALLLGSFAAMALLLSAIGIYGVLAYDVSQRTREIGIRTAIGATDRQAVMLILGQGIWKTTVGLVIGLAGAFALSKFIANLLYDMKPTDPLVYSLAAFLLMAVALLASYLPARRAAKVDPLVALRAE